jgi:hypothetical protein
MPPRFILVLSCALCLSSCKQPPTRPTSPSRLDVTQVELDRVSLMSRPSDANLVDSREPIEHVEPDIELLLEQVTTRQQCNIVMGCPAQAAIVAMGDAAIGPIIRRYGELTRSNYQKFHLIDLLGLIGSDSALPFLREQLKAPHWEARTRAARAIGRLGESRELSRLKEHLAASAGSQDFAFQYALAFAIQRLGGEGEEVLIQALSPESIGGRNWGYTRVAVEAVAELNVTRACPLLRVAVEHQDTFLKKSAIAAAGQLSCHDKALLGAIAAQLPSRVPSIRRAARKTLLQLTGITFGDHDQWIDYASKQPD